ncbi:MAG: decaprenyl-phosphate phosphoribosyltransferase [Anaerolineae bacterium]|nr:decaprenyl-phosphate phosphoribosyltransferase [Anaerolineae bacterium]
MIPAILKTMRPRQWTKNIFIFAALVFDRQLPSPEVFFQTGKITNLTPALMTLAGFFLFCMLSSTVYVINDIFDVESDRMHPVKRNRPIASGKLPIPVAITFSVILLLVTMLLAFLLSTKFATIALIYFLVNLAYSLWLKHIPLVDVIVLASGFVIRVGAGVSLIDVERFSPWLYVVTSLFALFIGFGKRRAELSLLAERAENHRRVLNGYTIPFLDQLIMIVSSTTIVSYSLYTFSAPNLPDNHSMMLTIPFVLYGIFRYLYLLQVKNEGGAPEELALHDRPLQATVLMWALAVLVVFYIY